MLVHREDQVRLNILVSGAYLLYIVAIVGSKRGILASGTQTGKSGSNIQVIFNGKIVTPQSLIPRKQAPSNTAGGKKAKDAVASIPENGPDSPDRLKSMKKSGTSLMPILFASF